MSSSILPSGNPSTTPPTPLVSQRPLARKLALAIPCVNTSSSTSNLVQTPAPQKVAATPLRMSKPKLSLAVTPASKKPALSLATSILPPVRQSTPELEEEDVTARNTIANQRLTAEACAETSQMDIDSEPSYTVCPVPGVKPILKRGIRSGSSSSASSASTLDSMDYSMSSSISSFSSTFSLAKSVSFDMSPSYIPRAYIEDDEDLIFEDLENMSPPSTTSSTDSEESESDNECKTPVDTTQSGWMTRKFANKPGFGGSGRWKKAKREWVWTLGDCSTNVEQHHQHQGMGYNNDGSNVWVAV